MKKLFFAIFALALMGVVFAQETDNFSNLDAPNAEEVGIDSAEQRIKEISVDKFEKSEAKRS